MTAPAPVTPAAKPPRSLGARAALALVRALAPIAGEPRAQWLVGRAYALIYLVRYYLSTQYAKASLGVLWVALAPLLLIAVYLPIFLFVFPTRLPGRGSTLDYALFCLVGLMAWAVVQDALGQGAGSLVWNASIVRHAPTPPIMLPIVKVLGSFAGLALGLVVLVVVLAVTGRAPGARLVALPLAFGLLFAFLLGAVLVLAIASAYVRDTLQILPTVLSIEFFAAPILYPLESTSGMMRFAIGMNPLSPYLGLLRAAILPWHELAWADVGLATAWAAAALLVGIRMFRRLEGGLGDVV